MSRDAWCVRLRAAARRVARHARRKRPRGPRPYALLHLQDRMDELTVSMASEEVDADREAMEAEMADLQVRRWRGRAMRL